MHTHQLDTWQHSHVFDQDRKRAGEVRTLIVVLITAVMMVVEIATGIAFNSMALLADGLHMGSHAAALGLALFAYVISRRLAASRRFSFGVGKINSLAGFTSAVLLLGFAFLMASESIGRFMNPLPIEFDKALWVAVLGLLVNGVCGWILVSSPHEHAGHHAHGHDHGHDHDHGEHGHDHNLRAAYLHVFADALTSFLAIFALLMGKYVGADWLDPAMGIVGAVLVARWSVALIGETSAVLLDRQVPDSLAGQLRAAVERGSTDRVADLHYWSIGHGIYAAELVVVSHDPQPPDHYKSLVPAALNIVHFTVEVHRCD